jgi:hypothetical protein
MGNKLMKLEICGLNPMPRNRSHQLVISKGRPMQIKTPLARLFEEAMLEQLSNYEKDRCIFMQEYMQSTEVMGLAVNYVFYTPDLLTKEGKISKTSIDLDAHKLAQDVLFKWLEIDDSQILIDFRSKALAEEHSMSVSFEWINLDAVTEYINVL